MKIIVGISYYKASKFVKKYMFVNLMILFMEN